MDVIHPLSANFYNDQVEESYGGVFAMLKTIGFFSLLAISIASLGIFGMVVFMTETRLREVSIRKVFGSSELSLVYHLSRGSLMLLSVSALIALPLAYILFDQVILPNIPYHATLHFWDLLPGAVAVTAIALVMIGGQTLKTAKTNPADVLKNE